MSGVRDGRKNIEAGGEYVAPASPVVQWAIGKCLAEGVYTGGTELGRVKVGQKAESNHRTRIRASAS